MTTLLLKVATSRFVTIELAASVIGLSVGTIRSKVARARWREGVHFVRRDGRVLIDLQAYCPPPSRQQRLLKAIALKNHHRAKRRAAELQRTPPWADFAAIRSVYEEARRRTVATGIAHHVDHVIPLCGVAVSGLHVHTNLQILTGSENSRKKNGFEVSP